MRPRSRSVAVLATLIAATALVACGDGDDDEGAVREAVVQFVEAGNTGDFATVCDLLSDDQRAAVAASGESCAAALRAQAAGREGDTRIGVDEVRISGDRATVDATITSADGERRAQSLLLVKEDGDWKIASAGLN